MSEALVGEALLEKVGRRAVIQPFVEGRATAAGHGELPHSTPSARILDGGDQLTADTPVPGAFVDDEFLQLSGFTIGVEQPRDRRQGVPDELGRCFARDEQQMPVRVGDRFSERTIEGGPIGLVVSSQLFYKRENGCSILCYSRPESRALNGQSCLDSIRAPSRRWRRRRRTHR